MSRAALLLACLALLGGCSGWHLRGSGPLAGNVKSVYLLASDANTVTIAVRQELYNRGIQIAARPSDADVIVDLAQEHYDRRVISIDPATGKVSEIELGLRVYFTARAKDGKLLVPREPITWQSEYVFNESSILGTVEQDSTVQRDLAQNAATTLVLRIQTLKLPKKSS